MKCAVYRHILTGVSVIKHALSIIITLSIFIYVYLWFKDLLLYVTSCWIINILQNLLKGTCISLLYNTCQIHPCPAMRGASSSSAATWGVLVKDTSTHMGFKPATFWLLDDPLYLLSYSLFKSHEVGGLVAPEEPACILINCFQWCHSVAVALWVKKAVHLCSIVTLWTVKNQNQCSRTRAIAYIGPTFAQDATVTEQHHRRQFITLYAFYTTFIKYDIKHMPGL